MPCIVPTCCTDSVSESTLRSFPNNEILAERWLQSIQIGCGLVLDEFSEYFGDQFEICDRHFTSDDPDRPSQVYQEPSRFANA